MSRVFSSVSRAVLRPVLRPILRPGLRPVLRPAVRCDLRFVLRRSALAWLAFGGVLGVAGRAVPRCATAAPLVVSVSPTPQAIEAAASTDIVFTFDTSLDPASVSPGNVRVYGRWSGPASGTLSLENGDTRIRFVPSAPFFAGEWVTASIDRGILDAALDPIAAPYAFSFWIDTAPGSFDVVEIATIEIRGSGEGPVVCYGGHGGDLDNDGFTDLSLVNEASDDVRVFVNDQSGMYSSFTTYPFSGGGVPSTNEPADFDGDGDIDMAVGSRNGDEVRILIGDGSGGYAPQVVYTVSESVRGLGVLDFDGDGDTDIVSANHDGNEITLLPNNGDGTFGAAIGLETGGNGETALGVADFDEDGILDLVVGALDSEEFLILLGDGAGGFTVSDQVSAGGTPWMIAVGDIDLDGHVDVAAANAYDNDIAVAFGDGLGNLSAATLYPTGAFPVAVDLGDLDGDGDLDLVASNFVGGTFILFENDGTGAFPTSHTLIAPDSGSCTILHDRDNDGDLDISGIDELDDLLILYENEAPATAPEGGAILTTLAVGEPNPFMATTRIRFALERAGEARLTVYGPDGRWIRTLLQGYRDAGPGAVEWDGRDSRGRTVPAGVYAYRLEVDGMQGVTAKVVRLSTVF